MICFHHDLYNRTDFNRTHNELGDHAFGNQIRGLVNIRLNESDSH